MKAAALSTRRLLLGAVALWPVLKAWPASSSAGVVRVGLTPVFLDDRVRLLRQWREHLESVLDLPVEFVQRSTYAQVLDSVRSGRVDFAWICGYPYVRHQRELALVAVPHWHGQPLYRSYLIAAGDAPIRSVADMRGRTFAYSDPLSNSGFLYVQHLLRSEGFDPGRHFARSFFTHSHRHVVNAVADGLADAGAVDGYVWETLAEVQPALTARTRVLHRSGLFGFPPVVAAPTTSIVLRHRFQRALLGMADSVSGRVVLAEMRLDRFAPESPQLFRSIAAMAREQG